MRTLIVLSALLACGCGDPLEGFPKDIRLPADSGRTLERKADGTTVSFIAQYPDRTMATIAQETFQSVGADGWTILPHDEGTWVLTKGERGVGLFFDDQGDGTRVEVVVPVDPTMLAFAKKRVEEKKRADDKTKPPRKPVRRGELSDGAKTYYALLEKGCDGGSATDCWRLGVAHKGGLAGLAKDDARAAALFKKGCAPQNPEHIAGCVDHVRLQATLGRKELAVVATLCDRGRQDACKLAIARTKKPPRKLLLSACAAGILDHCLPLRPKDAAKGTRLEAPASATDLAKKAVEECNNRAGFACGLLSLGYNGGLYGLPRDGAKAIEVGKRACNESSVWGCYPTAAAAFSRAKTPQAMANALSFAQTGCKRNEAQSCSLLARVFERDETQPTRLHSLHYRLALCHWGFPEGNPCNDFARSAAAYPGALKTGQR